MQVISIKTRIFRENEDLISFILKYVKNLKENSVLVVTSKIVALAEGRTTEYKNKREKIKLIKKESEFALKTKYTWLTIKDGFVMPSSGIDESNANGKVVLLPKDSFKSAEMIRTSLRKKFGIKKLGVIVSDSRIFPLRQGVMGFALGYAGFQGLKDYVGKKDIFGRVFKMSKTDVADSLATSAVLCMGEGREQKPLAVITDSEVVFKNKINKKELMFGSKGDLYYPLLKKLKSK